MAKKEKRESNQQLLEKLVAIRKKTGLNQEQFYKKYLSMLNIRNPKSDSSIQGFMRDLENGYVPLVPSILLTYANIENKTVDFLISDVEIPQVKNDHEFNTFADFLNTFFPICENLEHSFTVVNMSDNTQRHAIVFNEAISEFLGKLESIEKLKTDKNFDAIYSTWKQGTIKDAESKLKKYDYRDARLQLIHANSIVDRAIASVESSGYIKEFLTPLDIETIEKYGNEYDKNRLEKYNVYFNHGGTPYA